MLSANIVESDAQLITAIFPLPFRSTRCRWMMPAVGLGACEHGGRSLPTCRKRKLLVCARHRQRQMHMSGHLSTALTVRRQHGCYFYCWNSTSLGRCVREDLASWLEIVERQHGDGVDAPTSTGARRFTCADWVAAHFLSVQGTSVIPVMTTINKLCPG